MKRGNFIALIVLFSLQVTLTAVGLVFVVLNYDKATKVDTFYRTVSQDYRDIVGGAGNAVPVAAAPQREEVAGECFDFALFDLESDPSKGALDAPVTIVEYSDFQCPFCARFASGAYTQIIDDYIDTGLVRIIYKDFPLDGIHPLATPAAVAANCIAQELGDDTFFDFHDVLYQRQESFTPQNIRDWALDAGLSAEQFDACNESDDFVAEIQDDLQEGSRFGVTGTPTFFINGQKLVGAQPYQAIKTVIDREIAGDPDSCGG